MDVGRCASSRARELGRRLLSEELSQGIFATEPNTPSIYSVGGIEERYGSLVDPSTSSSGIQLLVDFGSDPCIVYQNLFR